MVVQTQALARASGERAQPELLGVGSRGRVIVAAVVVAQTTWLLTLGWGVYALAF